MKNKNSNSKINFQKKKNIANRPISVKKLRIIMIIIFLLFFLLIVRIFFLQFVQGASLKEKASRQQTVNKIISPKRGTIYDSTGKALAISASVDTVSINPTKIEEKDKEKVAKILSEIFELDYSETLNKVSDTSSIQTISKKVEKEKIDKLKTWMEENKITSGINIDEDTKRYYPYDSLASHVIGFTGTDNQGLYGIELAWDDTLTGTSGKIVTSGDVNNDEISNSTKQYVEVENGSDLYLTIDVNIQSIVEKYLEEAVSENQAEAAGAILMNPNTGDILAMASYPNYNLNTPFEPNTSTLSSNWDNLSSTEKNVQLGKMWKDKNFSSTYEPGSTFKVLMSAIALEENITSTDISADFNCIGYQDILGTKIRCWKTSSHGYESLRDALANSCNPAFMQLGSRIGKETLYRYFEAFGLFEKTGIAIAGESSSTFHKIEDVGPVELATISFGQRFEITPLQLITAVSSIANNGTLVTPRIVKQINNPNTGTVTEVEVKNVRQVVSKETAAKVRSMMETVVESGTGKYGAVEGFSIGGKTGTSEPVSGNEQAGYIVSFVAISPVENPEIVALIEVYNPGGSNPEGSKIAAPTMSKILSEVLPYVGMTSNNATSDILSLDTSSVSPSYISIPNITNKTVTEAKKILSDSGLNAIISTDEDENSIIVSEQYPSAGTQVLSNSSILLYTESNNIRTSVTVPDLTGLTLASARSSLTSKNLNITYEGSGKVISQSISKDTTVEEGTIIHVVLKQ